MDLDDASNGERPDLDKAHETEMVGLQDLNLPFVAEKYVRLVLEGVPVDGPEGPAASIGLDRRAVIGIVEVMVVHGREAG